MLERKISPLEQKVDLLIKTVGDIAKRIPATPLLMNVEVTMAFIYPREEQSTDYICWLTAEIQDL